MKRRKEVDATRREYHRDPLLNTVHRSSLMAPPMTGSSVEVSLLNHFLLKRSHTEVGCRVTAIDQEGKRIAAKLIVMTEPRVYTHRLAEIVDCEESEVSCFQVEFFSAQNLFIPFTAAVINHVGAQFINTVHSYNRVLNDVFEDDTVNANQVAEASIDVRIDDETDTFACFMTGPAPVKDSLTVELDDGEHIHSAEVDVETQRFGVQDISLKELFASARPTRGILKICQPEQFMFYGRLLAGIRKSSGAFSANHSFYDCSSTEEYWPDDQPSYRIYPVFPGVAGKVRMYPIMSPGRLEITADFYARDGSRLASAKVGELTSPGRQLIEYDFADGTTAAGIDVDDVSAIGIGARPLGGQTPTRVNHQLVYGMGALESSVNASLANPNVFVPPNARSLKWGQAPAGEGFDSWIGINANTQEYDIGSFEIAFYDTDGEISRQTVELSAGACWQIRVSEILAVAGRNADQLNNVWYYAQSSNFGLSANAITWHTESGHCTGEHAF